MTKGKVWIMAVLLSFGFVPLALSAPEENPYCTSEVFIYIDCSASISESHREFLAKELGKILAEEKQGLITKRKSVKLIAFGASVGSTVDMTGSSDVAAISQEIEAFLRQNVKDDGEEDPFYQQTDVVAVLEHISATSASYHPVFIIVSDFEHDVTEKNDPEGDLDDWNKRGVETIKGLAAGRFQDESLSAEERPVLLLLSLTPDSYASEIKRSVLDKENGLQSIVPYYNQVKSVYDFERSLRGFARYIDPISFESKVVGSNVEVTIYNKSCRNLPPLRAYSRNINNSRCALPEPVTLRSGFGAQTVTVPLDDIRKCPSERDQDRRLAEIEVIVDYEQGLGKSKLSSRKINVDQFLSLKSLSGHSTLFNGGFGGKVSFKGSLWGYDKVQAYVVLRSKNGGEIGRGKVDLSASDSLDPELITQKFAIEDMAGYLPKICNSKSEGDLEVEIDPEGEAASLMVQHGPIPVRVVPSDSKDLLESLVQLGSFPALFALFSLLVMVGGRRHLTIAGMEEILAIAGLFWLTVFFLCRRFSPWGDKLDVFLSGGWSYGIGICIAVLLAMIGKIAFDHGVIFPPKDAAEINLELAREAAGVRGALTHAQKMSWDALLTRWVVGSTAAARSVVAISLIVFPLVLAAGQTWNLLMYALGNGSGKPECTIEAFADFPDVDP